MNDDGVIPTLKDVSDAAMPFIEGNAISAVEAFHPPCQIWFRCFEEEMVMVAHKAVTMAEPSILLDSLPK